MPLFPNYSACTWCTTPLSAVPLVGNTYDYDIIDSITTCISASTIYQYRAYVVICGTPYYGNILSGATDAVGSTKPEVNTGLANPIHETYMLLTGNTVTDKGGLPLAEYGVLYTQIGSYGNTGCMIYEAFPSKICKKSIYGDISTGVTYFTGSVPAKSISGLTQNTLTYFRAFAKNANGSGYGDIETASTLPSAVELYFGSIVSGNIATVTANNLVLQTMDIVFEYHVEASADNNYDDPGYYPNQARTYLEISLDGGSTWTYIEDITAQCDQPQDSDYQVRNGTYTITGINATNISLIKIRGGYDCAYDRSAKSGYFSIRISNTSTIDSGTLTILTTADEFDEGCNQPPTIS